MNNDLEKQMEDISDAVNQILKKSGLNLTISDINFTVNPGIESESVSSTPSNNTVTPMTTSTGTLSSAAITTNECWKWKCFTTPTGTKCIKVPC